MLQSIYGRGTVATSKCNLSALNNFMKVKKKEGCFIYFIQDPVKGMIIPERETSVQRAVDAGQAVVLRLTKSPNIVVLRKLRGEETTAEGLDVSHLTHAYDVISVCTSKRTSPAKHTVSNLNLTR